MTNLSKVLTVALFYIPFGLRRARLGRSLRPAGCPHWRTSSEPLCTSPCICPHTAWKWPGESREQSHDRIVSFSWHSGQPETAEKNNTTAAHLQFLRSLVAQRLQREAEVVVISQRAQVKVVFGVDAGRDVDVELEELQEVPLHLIPAGGAECAGWKYIRVNQGPWYEKVSIQAHVQLQITAAKVSCCNQSHQQHHFIKASTRPVIVNCGLRKITLQPRYAHLYLQCGTERLGWQCGSLFASCK